MINHHLTSPPDQSGGDVAEMFSLLRQPEACLSPRSSGDGGRKRLPLNPYDRSIVIGGLLMRAFGVVSSPPSPPDTVLVYVSYLFLSPLLLRQSPPKSNKNSNKNSEGLSCVAGGELPSQFMAGLTPPFHVRIGLSAHQSVEEA